MAGISLQKPDGSRRSSFLSTKALRIDDRKPRYCEECVLFRENDGCRRLSGHKFNRTEPGLTEPGSVIGLAPGVPALRHQEHLRREHEGERMTCTVVVGNEVINKKRTARF